MNVLVDTSVWSDHFRKRNAVLSDLIFSERVLIHPMIIGELACGTPPEPRQQTLSDLELLVPVNQATTAEVRSLLERERLYGQGCGIVDLTLLASTLITPAAKIWTLDKRLSALARQFGVAFDAPKHPHPHPN